jgi:MFS family permease
MENKKTIITPKASPSPAGEYRSYFKLLANNTRFRHFWIAGVISQLGNWFNYIAIFVLLTRLTGSGQAVSWFLLAKFMPTSVLGPAAGVLADKISRKTIMVSCDLLRVLVVLSFLFVKTADQVWLIYLLALLQESLWTFADPAKRASVPNLCQPDELNVANGLSGATWSIMLAFGAALGGFVSAAFGWRVAIIIDATSFLLSALILSRLELPGKLRSKQEKTGWAQLLGINDLREGFRYVAANKEVSMLLLVKSGWALSGGILVMLTVFGEQVFSTAGQGGNSGILYSFRGIGAALGPILAWRFFGESNKSMYRSIGMSFFISSASYLLFSQAPTLAWAALCVLCGHIGGAIQWVFSTTLLQQLVPDKFRGRVFAAEMALLPFVLSLSTYFTGAALDHGMDPRQVVMRLALLFLVPGSIWTVYRLTVMKKIHGK